MNRAVFSYPLLTASLAESPIIDKGGYDYFVHPLSDGVPTVSPKLLAEATDGLVAHARGWLADADKLVTAEAMGLPLVTALSLKTGLPFVVARKRSYGLPGERALAQKTGYGAATLYLNSIDEGDRVIVVDDVISTGGTLRALVGGIRDAGATPLGVAAVFSKDPELQALAQVLGCPVSALVSCRVVGTGRAKRVEVVGTDLHGGRVD